MDAVTTKANRQAVEAGNGRDFQKRKPRILVAHDIVSRGGAEATLMLLLQELPRYGEVTFLTAGDTDLEALNKFCSTQVDPREVRVRRVPGTALLPRGRGYRLRKLLFDYFAIWLGDRYDIRICTYNFVNWRRPGIHFIGDVYFWSEGAEAVRDSALPEKRLLRALHTAYRKAMKRLTPKPRLELLKRGVVVANSHYSARIIAAHAPELRIVTIYPPILLPFPESAGDSWESRENAFLSLSRIDPAKRIEDIIEILKRVRSAGHPVKLYLCGYIGNDPYGSKIAALCAENVGWIEPQGMVQGERKIALLKSCRYGISACPFEWFGIAVAEMVKAGQIVFTPNGGGQTEILECDDLLFSGVEDAARKIIQVLESTVRQQQLRSHLAARARQFEPEQVKKQYLELIREQLRNL